MYHVKYTDKVIKILKKTDKSALILVKTWIEKNLEGCDDPRVHGKPLVANRKGQWRYRIGDYRLLAEIDDNELIILAIDFANRSKIYK